MNRKNSVSSEAKEAQIGVRYITHDLLKKIVGSLQFENVISLNLTLSDEAGQIKYIENLNRFRRLKKLTLSKNCIEKIDNISHLVSLKELNLSNNCVTKIEGLELLINLQVLDLSYNKIRHVPKWLPHNLSQLRIFKIENNRLEDMTEFLWFRGLVNFVSLNVLGNLFTQNPHYKFYLLFHLRFLQKLNDEDVTSDQREQARQMYDQVEIDRLTNLVHEKETECSQLAGTLKDKIENIEIEEKSRRVLEEKNKEFEKLSKENNEKLEVTHDILKKKTRNFMDVNLKQIELEHNLAFYKIDHKFDTLIERSLQQNLPKSTDDPLSTDSSSTFGESPYIGKAMFKQSIIPSVKTLPSISFKTVKYDAQTKHFYNSSGQRQPNNGDSFCNLLAMSDDGLKHSEDHSSDGNKNVNYDYDRRDNGDHDNIIAHEPIFSIKSDVIPPQYFEENTNFVEQTNLSTLVYEENVQHRILSMDISEDVLDKMQSLIGDIKYLISLQPSDKIKVSDKVKELKYVCRSLLKEDLRDATCSPHQVGTFDWMKPNFKYEEVYEKLTEDLRSAFDEIKDLRTQVANCELKCTEKSKNQATIEKNLHKQNKPISVNINKDMQNGSKYHLQNVGTINEPIERDVYDDKAEMEAVRHENNRLKKELIPKKKHRTPPIKSLNENGKCREVRASIESHATVQARNGGANNANASKDFTTRCKLSNNGEWFCNIPCHMHWDEGLNSLKEKFDKIIRKLNKNKKSIEMCLAGRCCSKEDYWTFEKLLKKLSFRGRSLDVLDLAIEDQKVNMKHLERLERCLWEKRSHMNEGIQQAQEKNFPLINIGISENALKLHESAQVDFELKKKKEELSRLERLCRDKMSILNNVRHQTSESIKEFEKQNSEAISQMDANAMMFANLKNELQCMEAEKKYLQNEVKFSENIHVGPSRIFINGTLENEKINASCLDYDSEIILRQEKLCETLDLISKHEAKDEEILKNTEKKLLDLQVIKKQFDSMKNEKHVLANSIEVHQSFLKEIQQDFHSVEKLVKSLKVGSKKIDKELVEKMKQRDNVDDEISKKSEKLNFLDDLIKRKMQSVEELENNLYALKDKSSVLTKEIGRKSNEMSCVMEKLPNNILVLRELEIKIQQRGNELMMMTSEKNALNLKLSQMLQQQQDLESEIKKVQADLNDFSQKRMDVESGLKNAEKDLEILLSKLFKITNSCALLESQRDDLLSCVNQMKKEATESHLQLSDVQSSIRNYTMKLQTLLKKIHNLQNEKHAALNELNEIEQKVVKAKKDLESITSECQLSSDALIDVKKEIENNKNDLHELEVQLKGQKGILEQAEKNDAKESLLTELLEEKMLLNETTALHKKEKEELLLKLEQSNTELVHLKIDFCDKTKKLVEMKLQLEEKLEMAAKLVMFLINKSHGLIIELSALKSQHTNENDELEKYQDMESTLASLRNLMQPSRENHERKHFHNQGNIGYNIHPSTEEDTRLNSQPGDIISRIPTRKNPSCESNLLQDRHLAKKIVRNFIDQELEDALNKNSEKAPSSSLVNDLKITDIRSKT